MGFLLGLLGTIAVIYWRLKMISDASKELSETAKSAKGAYRRWQWRRKLNVDVLKEIQDPREAAAVMLCAIASHEGVMTDKAQRLILRLMMEHFHVDGQQAGAFLAFGRHHAKDVGDLTSFLRRLTPSINQKLNHKERSDLIDMLYQVSSVDSPTDDIEKSSIENLRRLFAKL